MNKNKIITLIFVLVIFYFPIHASCLYIISHFNKDYEKSSSKKIKWEKLYPFKNKKNQETINLNSILFINTSLRNKIKNIENSFDSYLPYKYRLCEIQMAISKLLGVKLYLEYDGLVVLNNDYFEYWKKYKSPKKDSENTIQFADYLNKSNIDFIYVQFPCKNSKYDNQLPKGLKDNNNITCDEFLKALNDKNIKALDLRDKVKSEYKSQYELFFRTDHHWKPSAGLWAAKEICKYLNEKLNCETELSLLDKDRFKTSVLPSFFLGSQGKKITLSYAKPEDFEILEPLYDTNFHRICPEWGDLTGSFKKVMFSDKHIKEHDLYNQIPYDYYLNGNEVYLKLINNSDYAFNKKVLLIRDSFSSVVSPFLALCIKDLTMIDPRYFKGSIKTIIEKEKFDLVIIAYNANCITTSKVFNIE